MPRLLIDENLSPTLQEIAHERGYECSHVSYLGLSGTKDWELKDTIIDGDWTFLTANNVDFRGPVDAPGTSGEYADVQLHAGLICVTASVALNRDGQQAVFRAVLDELDSLGDLTNKVLEVEVGRTLNLTFRVYHLPPDSSNDGSST